MTRAAPAAFFVTLILAGAAGAAAGTAPPPRPDSAGSPAGGQLRDGFALPMAGYGFRLYGPVRERGTQFVTLELGALISRVARVVARHAPGPALVVADASLEGGGPVRRHRSHQSGRDVDLLFLAVGPDGAPRPHERFTPFDAAGLCRAEGCDVRFDDARNWWVVRTLAASRDPAVQYIFVADHLRDRLLSYAEARGEHPEILRRAEALLRQPSDSSPHDDHFHVRIYCPPTERAASCRDVGARWPWVDAGTASPIAARP